MSKRSHWHACVGEDFPEKIQQDPSEGGVATRAAMQRIKKWPNEVTLSVGFWDSHPSPVEEAVREIAPIWERYANLKFEFVGRNRSADIRVGFDPRGGHYSALGTDSANRTMFSGKSMNLALRPADSDEELHAIILHEFGHSLGLIHEHQNPKGGIPWNTEATYKWFQQQYGWSRQMTFQNVLQKYEYDQRQWVASAFDPHSIMIYEIPGFLTGGAYELKRQSQLSESDKTIIATVYPGRWSPGQEEAGADKEEEAGGEGKPPPPPPREPTEADAVPLAVDGKATSAEIGTLGEVDLYSFKVSTADGYVVETEGETDVTLGLFGPGDLRTLIKEDEDSGRDTNARTAQYLRPGVYFVKVWHASRQGTGKYRISVTTWKPS